MSDEERKLARLKQDLSEEVDVESLLEVGRFLNQWSSPPADPAKLAQVIADLTQETARFRKDVQVPAHNIVQTRREWLHSYALLTLTVLHVQIRIVRNAIWLASALVMALGALVTMMTYSPTVGSTVLMIVTPLVAALGIAFIYGEDIDPPTELLMSTPVSPRLVLMARMALVFGFDLTLGLLASLAAALTTDISFMPLVMTWLAPMAFLSMLAFLMSVVFNDPLASVLISMGIWIALCIGHLSAVGGVPSFVPDLLSDTSIRVAFWGLSVTMGVLALWIAGREEHLLGRMKS